MARSGLSYILVSALAILGLADAAHAQQASSRLTLQESVAARGALTPDQSQWTGQTTRNTLEWDASNWGVRLDLDQPANRQMRPGDVQAGAYYRITPALKVGGAVSLGDKAAPDRKATPAERVAPQATAGIALKF